MKEAWHSYWYKHVQKEHFQCLSLSVLVYGVFIAKIMACPKFWLPSLLQASQILFPRLHPESHWVLRCLYLTVSQTTWLSVLSWDAKVNLSALCQSAETLPQPRARLFYCWLAFIYKATYAKSFFSLNIKDILSALMNRNNLLQCSCNPQTINIFITCNSAECLSAPSFTSWWSSVICSPSLFI